MPVVALLLPPALLAAAAALGWGLGLTGRRSGRAVAAGAAWLALLMLTAAWFRGGRTLVEMTTAVTASVAPLRFRVDAVTVLFQLAVLVPAALLLTFQRRSSYGAALAALATAAALSALAGGSLVWTAVGLGVCTSLVLILLRQEETRMSVQFWIMQAAAWLLLLWAAVSLEAAGGTSVYGAVPVTALHLPIFTLMAAAAVLYSGLLPWRTWVSEAWTRRRLEAGTLAVAVLVPLGFYPLLRAYGMGAGQWPGGVPNLVMAAVGAATALGAAVRAQAAATRNGYLAEAVPLASGLALLAIGAGTPLGLVAGLIGVLAVAAVAGLAPLVPDWRGPGTLLAIAVMAGAPPAVVFGGWLLTVQAAVESSAVMAFLGLAGAAAWLLGLGAAARALRLPHAERGAERDGSHLGSLITSAAAVAAGIALTGVIALLALPAAVEVMPASAGRAARAAVSQSALLGAGSFSVSTSSGGWSPALLGGTLVVVGVVAAVAVWLVRRRAVKSYLAEAEPPPKVVALEPAPPPLFAPPLSGIPERACARLVAVRLPEQYRSLFRPALLERAATRSRPWFWAVVTLTLAIVVTR